MNAASPDSFRYTTTEAYPDVVAGVDVLDENWDETGIYLRTPDGKLWPARTVSFNNPRYAEIIQAWLSRDGVNRDRRTARPETRQAVKDAYRMADELRAKGWTRNDAAKALKKMLDSPTGDVPLDKEQL